MARDDEYAIFLNGSYGVGKSAVLDAVGDRLAASGRAFSVMDVDWFHRSWPVAEGDTENTVLEARNIAAVWANYRAAGPRQLVLSGVATSSADLDRYAAAVGLPVRSIRLVARPTTLEARLRNRYDEHRRPGRQCPSGTRCSSGTAGLVRRGPGWQGRGMTLPADAHVHSEFSWDAGSDPASVGSMRRTCERAVRIGLPALVFTEHLDLEDHWRAEPDDLGPHARALVDEHGAVRLPTLDVDGYLDAIDRCRHDFRELTILTGVEFGQPHLWDTAAADVLSRVDRVNGSLHMLPLDGEDRTEPITLYQHRSPSDVVWAYLEELPRMIAGSDSFAVLTHIDYAARAWPTATAGPFDPREFEEGFRAGMRALAASGRALEMNTRRLWSWVPQWWAEEGGRAVTFGSDAHSADVLASGFPEAVAMAEHFGFRPGRRPEDFWTR